MTHYFADDAYNVVRELGLAPAIAIGSSMGGVICQRWAPHYLDDISHQVLASAWAEHDPYLDVLLRHWISLMEAGQAADTKPLHGLL